jgi:mono/diheme cytochrome c family protein
MIRNPKLIVAFALMAAIIPVLAQGTGAQSNGKAKPKAAPPASADVARGQRVFEQNCSRCHNAPASIPPQITGTVLRHMRVRASLSAADERALLQFMNP